MIWIKILPNLSFVILWFVSRLYKSFMFYPLVICLLTCLIIFSMQKVLNFIDSNVFFLFKIWIIGIKACILRLSRHSSMPSTNTLMFPYFYLKNFNTFEIYYNTWYVVWSYAFSNHNLFSQREIIFKVDYYQLRIQ